ncbi:MAG: hypothetical protein NVS3B1_29560 [Marmoricola sp.]
MTGLCTAVEGFAQKLMECGRPAMYSYTQQCVHEHVRTGLLCGPHYHSTVSRLALGAAGRTVCATCWEGLGSHPCPVTPVMTALPALN